MAMQEPAPEQGAPAGGGEDPAAVLKNMIISTDQALTKISQVMAKVSPEAGEALAELNDQFRQVIEGAMAGGQGGGRQAPEQVPMAQGAARGAKPVM